MPPKIHGMRRTIIGAAVLVVVIIAVVLVVRARPPEPAAAPPPAVKTTTVRKGDLTNTRTVQAQLGFGAARLVKGAAGTVTKLPATGQATELGKELYRVDDQPVVVFFGATPLFRALDTPGIKGSDVAVVMDNLAALGYSVGTRPKDVTKAEFTPRVVEALKKWQKALGVEQTGTLAPGRVLVLDRPMRVGAVKAQLGEPATEELFEVTSTTRLVTLQLPVTEAGVLKADLPVTIEHPDNRPVPAKVTSLTQVAAPAENGGGPKVDIVVTPDNPADVADLDTAPVRLTVTTESRTGVLTVPLAALVALKEGGYAVQLPTGGLKAVQTGLYSQDKVEISGDGVVDGLEVVTAQ
ncbi:Putative peptidoglycan binding domain-containing protein [Lentzea albidocapillata subsp. violacea]|uniref:Putative peptidoglycan binding domain-containing protein n=2 Tax=Lentzea albidocapillata TaxID=40571 RepID=A0A1G8RJJ1_9PSEU|nr:Putative peptidoglycan binding domain-containing protein [Lentzea albidocapillata subsp. violacea]